MNDEIKNLSVQALIVHYQHEEKTSRLVFRMHLDAN